MTMLLEPVLARWRDSRDPKLGDLVVELGGPPDPVIVDSFDKLKPTALVQALTTALSASTSPPLSSLIPVIDRVVRTARGSWPVVELIAEMPADPRVARLALSLLWEFDKLPHTSVKLWRRLLDAVEHHGDPSCIPPLQAIQPREPTAATKSRLANIAKRLAKCKPLDAAELARLDEEPVPTPSRNGPALLAAIYADPASDDARTIYADLLSGEGDPRGEFIQLQLQRAHGTVTEAGKRRELALLKKHAKAWLGPLAPVIAPSYYVAGFVVLPTELVVPLEALKHVTFARGFVRRISTLSVPKHRLAVLDDPIVSTIEHATWLPQITSAMRSLHSIDHGTLALLESGRSFQRLGIGLNEIERDVVVATEVIKRFAHCRVRCLALAISSFQPRLAVDILAAAAHDNPTLVEFEINGGAPRNYEDTWGWRDLKLPYVERATIDFSAGRFEIRLRDNHVDIYSETADRQLWRWILEPLRDRPFASATVRNGQDNSGRAAAAMAREFAIAQTITDE
jgi:uncharacterized protein (TIGR02996 family)